MVVMNADTFDEVRAFNLTPMNIYVAVSSVLLLLSILIFLFIAYTPLRNYIPGYGDVVQRQELLAMENTIEDLTEQLEAQTAYVENFRRILVGDAKTFEVLIHLQQVILGECLTFLCEFCNTKGLDLFF